MRLCLSMCLLLSVFIYVFIHSCDCIDPRLPGPVCVLQSLYNTVPGLHTYGQPDTRAMNTNALLKERRLSVSVSVMSDSDSDDSSVPPFTRSSTRPGTAGKGNGGKQNLRPRALSATERPGNNRSGVDGGGAARSGRESPAKTGGGRPSTAGPLRSFGGAQSPPLQKRPSTSFTHHRSLGPKYGKNAYSEHDQSQRDKVLKKFQVIFDPEKKARTVNLSTFSTPIVVVASESENNNNNSNSNNNSNNNNNGKIHPTRTVIQVNGEEFHLDRKPQNHRRVVWSAQPGRKRGVMSAPSSARSRRPCSGSPAAATSSKLHSPSLTLLNGKAGHSDSGGGAASARGSPHRPVSPGRLDPKILALALQREFPVDYVSRPEKSSSDVALKVDSSCITRSQSPADQLKPPRKSSLEAKAQPKLSEGAKKQSIPHSPVKDCHPGAQIQPANHLQVPGSDHHPHHHHHHHHHPHHHHHSHRQHHQQQHQQQQQNGPASESGGQSRWTMVRNSIQRSGSRMSDASDITPPVELLAKLMRAGSKPGGEPTRPKTAAPSKSELSHRSMPAPRRTVAGILAQIENQKAHTRAMLDASKQLQKLVKKLVPREKLVAKHSEDWWIVVSRLGRRLLFIFFSLSLSVSVWLSV